MFGLSAGNEHRTTQIHSRSAFGSICLIRSVILSLGPEIHCDVRLCGTSGLIAYYALSRVKHEIKEQEIGCFLRLNRATLTALNVLPGQFDEPATHSLYGLLNRCKTPMGKRGLKVSLCPRTKEKR